MGTDTSEMQLWQPECENIIEIIDLLLLLHYYCQSIALHTYVEHTWVLVFVSVSLCNHTLLGKVPILPNCYFAHRPNELDEIKRLLCMNNYSAGEKGMQKSYYPARVGGDKHIARKQ